MRWRYVADIDHMDVRPQALLDKEYLKPRSRLIDPKRAQDFGHGSPPKGGTVYLTAADASGMMVSFIQSNYMGFGSGVVVDRDLAAEPRQQLRARAGPSRTASDPASARTRPSFPASSRKTAGR